MTKPDISLLKHKRLYVRQDFGAISYGFDTKKTSKIGQQFFKELLSMLKLKNNMHLYICVFVC